MIGRFLKAWWLLLPAAACLFLAGRLNLALLDARATSRLTAAPPLVNAPPLVVFTTVALGGFRGILADALWLRAASLQEQGRYFEIAQLADWITKLEPHVDAVWTYHAWNMAYNISYLFPEPEDRWRWVQNGIRLLRDEGLVYNPASPYLYRELGYIYQHKIGNIFDKAHWYYKFRLAAEMDPLMPGGRPPPDGNPAWDILRDRYRMRPDLVRAVDAEYGPLDWRLPDTHALYWADQGRRLAGADPKELAVCERMVYQCLTQSFRAGRLLFDAERGIYATTPYLELLPRVRRAYEEILSTRDQPVFHNAYANFLAEAVMMLATFNREAQARELHEDLVRRYPGPDSQYTFEEYIFRSLVRDIERTPALSVGGLIEGMFYQSLVWAALGEEARAQGFDAIARLLWREYMRTLKRPDLVQTSGLPPVEELRRRAAARWAAEQTAEPPRTP
jgi:hypothetical protein